MGLKLVLCSLSELLTEALDWLTNVLRTLLRPQQIIRIPNPPKLNRAPDVQSLPSPYLKVDMTPTDRTNPQPLASRVHWVLEDLEQMTALMGFWRCF